MSDPEHGPGRLHVGALHYVLHGVHRTWVEKLGADKSAYSIEEGSAASWSRKLGLSSSSSHGLPRNGDAILCKSWDAVDACGDQLLFKSSRNSAAGSSTDREPCVSA